MNPFITINPRHVHLWSVKLSDFINLEQPLLALLSPDETERALRFHFPLHKQRFIIAHGLLRKTLHLYTRVAPEKIVFTFGQHGKPYLQDNKLNLQFNMSHSEDFAVFALTTQQEIGVDIEKMEPQFNQEIAKRFFSRQEYKQLMTLPMAEKIQGFYRIWAKREAIMKALGEGLFMSLVDFSISLQHSKESIMLTHSGYVSSYHIESFSVVDDYQAAFATPAPVENILYKGHAQNDFDI